MNRGLYFQNLRNWYRRVFWRGDIYDETGGLSRAMQLVLQDLAPFCRAHTSCVVFDKQGRIDPVATALNEGRREVWLKITQTLHLTDEQLIQIMNAGLTKGDQNNDD